ncbi:MAG: ABC transporter ATP-binding protein [Prevotella sp.]|nr:ABC transporter ATP-binding protein [Prevotella sp.]
MKIDISRLRKAFGEKVAVDIDEYHVGDGEMIGLVGNNGAGKTTLFRLMLDLLKADDGAVEFAFAAENGSETSVEHRVNPAESEEWKEHTGAYVDDGFLIDFLTPEEFFEFVGKVCGIGKQEVEARVKTFEHLMAGEILEQKKLIRDFSAGNKQKIGIIAALLHQPSLVILDEPFNFLDPSSQSVLKRTLTEYNHATGATIIISSHNLAHTIDICPRITLLEHGHIVKDLSNIDHSAADELNAYFDQQASVEQE